MFGFSVYISPSVDTFLVSQASNATAPLGLHLPPEPDAMLVRLVPPAPCRPRGDSCRFYPLFMHHFSAHADLCLNPILCRLSTTWVRLHCVHLSGT